MRTRFHRKVEIMELVPAYNFETVKSRYINVINHTAGIEQYEGLRILEES